MPSEIFFCGDVHGHFEHVIGAVQEHRPAAIVFLGDLQAPKALNDVLQPILDLTDVWWIHGNHDTDSDTDYDNLFGSQLEHRNLDGRVVEIAGLRIAGLGGIFRSQIWAPPAPAQFQSCDEFAARCGKGNLWRNGLPRKHRSSIFPNVYARLAREQADILVTHEAPSCHPHGFDAIDELARGMNVRTTFHGHQHDQLDYSDQSDRLGFVAYGVNFCGIVDQDGNTIRTGNT
jgi:predicted phosphodiesterase